MAAVWVKVAASTAAFAPGLSRETPKDRFFYLMISRSLDDVAARFDEVYTRLTAIQRRLIAAQRAAAETIRM